MFNLRNKQPELPKGADWHWVAVVATHKLDSPVDDNCCVTVMICRLTGSGLNRQVVVEDVMEKYFSMTNADEALSTFACDVAEIINSTSYPDIKVFLNNSGGVMIFHRYLKQYLDANDSTAPINMIKPEALAGQKGTATRRRISELNLGKCASLAFFVNGRDSSA